jgi:ubiquitin-activating enzyme E1
MRVVAAVSNLRARNYSIPEADLHTSRGIAGKITPAIATTTAMVTAAICVELYKLLLDKPIEQLKNTFSNLALPLFTSAEPDPPKSTKAKVNGKDWVWTAVSTFAIARSWRATVPDAYVRHNRRSSLCLGG